MLPVAGVWEGSGEPTPVIEALAIEPGRILAGGPTGMYASADQGASWEAQALASGNEGVSAIAAAGGRAFAAGRGRLWEGNGEGWASRTPPLDGEIHQLLTHGENLLAATEGGLFSRPVDDPSGWQRVWPIGSDGPEQVHAVHATGDRMFLGTDDGVVELAEGVSRRLGPDDARVLGIASGGGWVHIAVAEPRGGLARLAAGSDRWEPGQVPSEYGATLLVDTRDPRRLYAGLGGLADGKSIAGVVTSEDFGLTWTPIASRLSNTFVPALALDQREGLLYAGTNGGGLFQYHELTPIHRALKAADPFLTAADPLLLGLAALALLLQRRQSGRRGTP